MAIARIATGNQNNLDLPIVLLQGWASGDPQDRTVDKINHSVVRVLVERTIDGTLIYADVHGWNSQYLPVLTVHHGNSVFVVGSLTANEKNGKRHYDVDAYFIAASGAGLGSLALGAGLDEQEEVDEPDPVREHSRDVDRDHTVKIEHRPDLNGDTTPIDPSLPMNDPDMPRRYYDDAISRRDATILDRLFPRHRGASVPIETESNKPDVTREEELENSTDYNQRLREHQWELSRNREHERDMDRDYGPTR